MPRHHGADRHFGAESDLSTRPRLPVATQSLQTIASQAEAIDVIASVTHQARVMGCPTPRLHSRLSRIACQFTAECAGGRLRTIDRMLTSAFLSYHGSPPS